LHPGKYISKAFIKRTLKKNITYTISSNDLVSDFAISDIVITNPFSTIFYDAVNIGIPVVRVLHFSTFVDFKDDFEGQLFDIYNYKQLQQIIDNIMI